MHNWSVDEKIFKKEEKMFKILAMAKKKIKTVLSKNQRGSLGRFSGEPGLLKRFYLTGGTASAELRKKDVLWQIY